MPQSTTRMPSACSRAMQFMPISPRPPSGTSRGKSPVGGVGLDWGMAVVRRVSVLDAKKLVDEGYAYLDVLSIEEFGARHPTGAINVPLSLSGPAGTTAN